MSKVFRILFIGVGIFAGFLAALMVVSAVVYSPQYVLRVLRMRESDVGDYLYNFPQRRLGAAAEPFLFADARDEARVAGLFEEILDVADFNAFLEDANTQAFIVIRDDAVLYEQYFNGTQRDTLATSFSVAKSFTSALVGIAIGEGDIASVDDPITDYLPELAARDPRFNEITVRHLLLMASGMEYRSSRPWLFNGDDPLSTYFPDQRQAALEFTRIIDSPGEYFLYNHYHPQLLGMILERSTGVPVTAYLQKKIWSPVGMEFDGSWSLDSEESGFEKMETGVNARPIDFARFGRLFLREGDWNGVQLVPHNWIAESTRLDPEIHNEAYYSHDFGPLVYQNGEGYYKYMWYGLLREGSDYDFFALGDRGQIIYLSPQHQLIIVRNGFEYGIPPFDWTDAFFRFSGRLGE